MAKDLKLVILLDFYGGLLTEKQAEALDCYYNQDLSLSEIADDMGISRQGVMAFLKQGEKHLKSFEEKLGLAARFERINIGLDKMKSIVSDIPDTDKKSELEDIIKSISENI
ncbi:MAG: sigma factor-like helix-turn-helix DNA-binding protein [Clostridia bacterium]|nr:sigma factor-like helix-turn-helix DNA-binding protein [Clostridia bacterium]